MSSITASNVVANTSYYRQRVRGAYDFTGRRYGSVSDVLYIDGTYIRVRIIFLAAEVILPSVAYAEWKHYIQCAINKINLPYRVGNTNPLLK